MNKRLLPIFIAMMPLLFACGSAQRGAGASALLRVEGNQVLDSSGKKVMLRGIAFGNQVWNDAPVPMIHHDERDYQRVAEMGMNTVRFYLNYITFEDDGAPGKYKASGWEWLDKNVAWAKKHGIYLVLNMHVPQGGYQSLNKGKALWEDAAAQERLIALWQAIAERYRNEPAIAGYDLLNEPVVSRSQEQWHDLAARLILAVREEDPDHILFIERVNAVDGDWKEDEDRNFFLVDDPNVVYEFHFYKPFHFTHQGAPWVNFAAKDTRYPDPNRVGVEWFLTDWRTAAFQSPFLPQGDSDWTYYESEAFTVSDPTLVLGKPALSCGSANSGKAYFDDLLLEQLNADRTVKREIWRVNPVTDRGWFFWKANGVGESSLESNGHGDNFSLSISKTTGDTNLSADIHMFQTEPGGIYRLSGWMKGEQIPPNARCQIRLDFWSARVPLHKWDKAFLAQELGAYLSWGQKHHVPMFLGEFGAIADSFQEDRGGERWVSDMLDLLIENNLHFTYHDYHETYFGLYYGDSTLPDPNKANDALIAVFKQKLQAAK